MQSKDFLENVCKQIKYKPIREDISKELENHIIERKEFYLEYGVSEDEAEKKAIEQMGNAEEIGKSLNQIHKPRLNIKLVIVILALLVFGILSAVIRNMEGETDMINVSYYINYLGVARYIEFIIFSIICGGIVYFIDYRKLKKYSIVFYIVATLMLVVSILCNIDFEYRILSQPRAFAKIVGVIAMPLYILAFAGFTDRIGKKEDTNYILEKFIDINIINAILYGFISLGLLVILKEYALVIVLEISYITMGIYKIFKELEIKGKCITNICKFLTIFSIFIIFCGLDILCKNIDTGFNAFYFEDFDNEEILNTSKVFGTADLVLKDETWRRDCRKICNTTFKFCN